MNKEEHMSITKCMIAGLPGSGKSTYIGALWYCLMHPEKIEGIKIRKRVILVGGIFSEAK